MSMFNTKFSCIKTEFSFVELDGTLQYPKEDMDIYLKSFNDRALDCCDQMVEQVLVDVCLVGTIEEYRIFVENLLFFF